MQLRVAVLLATYNGALFIADQIQSLAANSTPFTVHWLDDHSTDNTRELVSTSARVAGVELREWHQDQRQGIPGVFFKLLECVSADIYLFCDQDDIWQPGKIDATIKSLLPDRGQPALVYSDPLVFSDGQPDALRRFTAIRGVDPYNNFEESRVFTYTPAMGHTIGFTRALRDVFLKHLDIAREYAFAHDFWMYMIASACGTSRMLSDVPTTLYRLHGGNTFGLIPQKTSVVAHVKRMWAIHQKARRWYSRQAQGFCRAYSTLPTGPKLERLRAVAERVARLDRRQSPAAVIRLLTCKALPPIRQRRFWFAVTSLCSHSKL